MGRSGAVRAEFSPGAVSRLAGLALRDREDFSQLKARVLEDG